MRKLLLTTSAAFLLCGGVALAGNGNGNTIVPVIGNAITGGNGQSATTGGTNLAASLKNSLNETDVGNSFPGKSHDRYDD